MSGRVLVVDDEPSMCEALAAGLAPRGFTVHWEKNRWMRPSATRSNQTV